MQKTRKVSGINKLKLQFRIKLSFFIKLKASYDNNLFIYALLVGLRKNFHAKESK